MLGDPGACLPERGLEISAGWVTRSALQPSAVRNRHMIDTIRTDLWRVDVFERELDAIIHLEAALRLPDQAEIGVVHQDMDVRHVELGADRKFFHHELEVVVAGDRHDLASGSAARTPSAAGAVQPSGPAWPQLIQWRGLKTCRNCQRRSVTSRLC